MNDFTKEELIILHLYLDTAIQEAKIPRMPRHVIELRDKTQAMIDNHCDHASLEEGGTPKYNKCGAFHF